MKAENLKLLFPQSWRGWRVPARLPNRRWTLTNFHRFEAPALTNLPIADSTAPDAVRGYGNQRYEATVVLDIMRQLGIQKVRKGV